MKLVSWLAVRRLRQLLLAFLASALALACSAMLVEAAPAAASDTASATSQRTLYLLESKTGSLERTKAGLKLVLHDPKTIVTAIADRGGRLGAAVRLSAFLGSWPTSFGASRANAALFLSRAPAKRDVTLLGLSRPTFNRAAHTLVFSARRLQATNNVELRKLARGADDHLLGSFGRSTLYLDTSPSLLGSAIGYSVSFNLFGPQISNSNVQFSLTLSNSQFQDAGELSDPLYFGHGNTPVINWNASAQQTSFSFMDGLQLTGTMDIDLPSSGTIVDANVVLPQYYELQLSSEAGNILVQNSGPVKIPAPRLP